MSIEPDSNSGRRLSAKAKWTVFVAVRNEGSPKARLAGDRLGVGLLHMATVAMGALHGMPMRKPLASEDVGKVACTGAEQIAIEKLPDPSLAIAAIGFAVDFDLEWPAEADLFLSHGGEWLPNDADPADVPPSGDVILQDSP